MTLARQMPADFAEVSQGKSKNWLVDHYGCSWATLKRWLAEHGGEVVVMRGPATRSMPEDFPKYAHETDKQLMQRFKMGRRLIKRFRKECGVEPRKSGARHEAPEGFAGAAPEMTIAEIMTHWQCSERMAYRWCRDNGVTARKIRVANSTKPRLVATRSTKHFSPQNKPHLDMTRAGRAAEYLRRYGPVVRCNVGGRYDPNGDHWRRGSAILNAQEVIERAIRNGWDEHGWRRVA